MAKLTTSQNGKYIRKGIYPLDAVLSKFIRPVPGLRRKSEETEVLIDGDRVYMDSDRYWCFTDKGTVCCECGIEGKYFAKERTLTKSAPKIERYHFNLYAVDEDGIEVLMTKDHVLPVAQGGPNHIDNYRTMCQRCNCEKGNMNDNQWTIYKAFKNQMLQLTTEKLAKSHEEMVETIKSLQERMTTARIPKGDFSKDDQYKTICIMTTAVRRIIDARNGIELKHGQNIWQAPNLKLK